MDLVREFIFFTKAFFLSLFLLSFTLIVQKVFRADMLLVITFVFVFKCQLQFSCYLKYGISVIVRDIISVCRDRSLMPFAKYQKDLPASLIGKSTVVIALYYSCTTTSSTIEVKNLVVAEGKAESESSQDDDGETIGTAEAPITVTAALELINNYADSEESATDAYVKGKVVSVDYYNSTYKSLSYYISDDGTATNRLQVYSGKGLNGADFASKNDLKVGADVVVKGKLKKYMSNGTANPEINQGSEIVSLANNEGDGTSEPTTPQPSGSNLISNGDFETWENGLPTHWKSTTTASSAALSQTTDAHGGAYAVKVGHDASANKRIAYQEITLKAGTYVMSFYVKASTSAGASVRPGYTDVKDGKANSSYTYGDYVNDITTNWQQVTHSFTLTSETTLNILIMVPKNSGADPIIDDFSLTTSDGGLSDGGGDDTGGDDTPSDEVKAVTVAEFNAAKESSDVWYQLTGTIAHLEDGTYKNSTTYGNFDLTDSTGSVYVYGVVTEKGGQKAKFADLMKEKGIKDGSTITIIGNRGSYNGKIEVTNAYFVSVSN